MHEASYKEEQHKIKIFNIEFTISYSYGVYHSSLYINDNEILIYLRDDKFSETDLKANGIRDFKKKYGFNYKQLRKFFKKIISLENKNS